MNHAFPLCCSALAPWLLSAAGAAISLTLGCMAGGPASASRNDAHESAAVDGSKSSAPNAEAVASRSDSFDHKQALPSRSVVIRGIDGSLKVRGDNQSELRVHAEKSGSGSLADVSIEVVDTPEATLICAVYPGGECTLDGDLGHRDRVDGDVQVRFAVNVPQDATVRASLVNGSIDVETVNGEIHATTVNGSIHTDGSTAVAASTVNGSVKTRVAHGGPVSAALQTVNGSIDLALAASSAASISASTAHGKIHSDFPFATEASGFGPSSATGTVGQGGGQVNLETVNGAIHIERLVEL